MMHNAFFSNQYPSVSTHWTPTSAANATELATLRYEIARLQAENQTLREQLSTHNIAASLRGSTTPGVSTPMFSSSCERRKILPFDLQVLALGAGSIDRPVDLPTLSFQFNEDFENKYLRQYLPYIMEDLRCSIKTELKTIVTPTTHRQRAPPVEAAIRSVHEDRDYVTFTLRTKTRAFPKLEHGFNREAICLTYLSENSRFNTYQYILAVASRADGRNIEDGDETDDESTESNELLREWIDFEVKILRDQADVLLQSVGRTHGSDFKKLVGKSIHWYWLCGLIPAARMFNACKASELPVFFPKIRQQAPSAWPAAPTGEPAAHLSSLNATQVKVVSSLSTLPSAGLYNLIGPPGTGKTHTIAHLLAERVRNFPEQKILLTAPSNKAVRVVLSQLLKKVQNPPLVALTGVMKNLPAELEPHSACNFARYLTGPLRLLAKKKITAATLPAAQVELKDAHFHLISRLKTLVNAEGLEVADSGAEEAVMALLKDVKNLPTKIERVCRDFKTADALINHAEDIIKKISLCHANLEVYLLQKAHIVFTTLVASGRHNLFKVVTSFDTVIVDEAAQALIPETFIPFKFNPKLFVLIGDPQQLPGTVDHALEKKGYANSLMTILTKNQRRPYVEMLTTQYRMEPCINKFISDAFYGGELVAGQSVLERSSALACLPSDFLLSSLPSAFIDCRFREMKKEGGAFSNEEEAGVVIRTALYLLRHGVKPAQIGIITFYAAQVACLERLQLAAAREEPLMMEITISTVDGFQGDERDLTLISCVRTGHSMGFLDKFRRINVALSRAKHARWVFGYQAAFRESPDREGERNCVLRNFFAWLDDPSKNNTDPRTTIVDGDELCDALGMQPTPALPTAAVVANRQAARSGARFPGGSGASGAVRGPQR